MKKYITLITVIVILFGIIFIIRECSGPPPEIPDPIIKIERDTIRDTIPGEIPDYIPEIVYQDTGSIKYIPRWDTVDVDTSAILVAYFSTNFYRDTILGDSSGFVVVMDSITQNRIKYRKAYYKLYTEAISETTTITKPEKLRNKWFVGFGAGGNDSKFGFSGDIMILNKKDNAYSFKYDFLNKEAWVTMYFKIRLR